jgi:O-antigen ligase
VVTVVVAYLLIAYAVARTADRPWMWLVYWPVHVPVKQTLAASGAPFAAIDVTALLAVGTALALLYHRRSLVITRDAAVLAATLLLFVGWAALSYTWSPGTSYGLFKASRLAVLGPLLFVAGSTLVKKGDIAPCMAWIAVLSAVIYAKIAFIPAYEHGTGGLVLQRAGFGFGSENGAAAVAFAAPVLGLWLIEPMGWLRGRLIAGAGLGVLLVGGVLGGTRAVLGAVLLGPLFVALFTGHVRRVVTGVAATGLLAVLIGVYVENVGSDNIRASLFTVSIQRDASMMERERHWDSAVAVFASRPVVGVGVGGYAVEDGRSDVRWFPHNIILEALAELGMIGATLLIAALTFVLLLGWRTVLHGEGDHRLHGAAAVAAFLILLLQALVTDDLADNRCLWLAAALVSVAARPDER